MKTKTEVKHFMVDIETLSTKPDAAILSLAVTPFDIRTGKIGSHYYEKIELADCLKLGLRVSANTFYWWLQQSQKARNELLHDRKPLYDVLTGMIELISNIQFSSLKSAARETKTATEEELKSLIPRIALWSNPKEFDLVILQNVFEACEIWQTPWDWRYDKFCLREYVRIAPNFKETYKFDGVAHDPRIDNENQIKILCGTFKQHPERFSQFLDSH